jgi:hypothetical protein
VPARSFAWNSTGALARNLFILLVSLFWEATIAVPNQWWGFQAKQTVGMFINGFCGLPVDEPLLWLGVTWATVIIYETISALLFMYRSFTAPNGPGMTVAIRRE